MTDTILQELARFAATQTYDALPEEVRASVRQRILDSIGIQVSADAEHLGDGIRDMIGSWGGAGQSGVVGSRDLYPAPSAALLNGTLAHSLDFDDTHLPSVLHPSASIVPAAFAAVQAAGGTGKDLVLAIAIGLEICVRTGMGGYVDGVNVFFEKGWHATSICGAIGSAALGAKVLGLDETGIGHAMAISCSMASGVIEANRAGGTVKRIHCGWAAHAGLTAASMAKHGVTGPPTVFEGRFGFYNAFCDGKIDREGIVGGLGTAWEVPGIFFKPYPANHYTHAGIDAAMAIRARHNPPLDRIATIRLGAAEAPLRTIGEPREQKIRPQSGYHAQFSGPFTVAAALAGGGGLGVGFDDFTDSMAADPARLALAAKVETFVDEECNRVFPNQFPAVVQVIMDDGTTYEERRMVNRGGPGNPLSDEELRTKFLMNALRAMPRERADALADLVFGIDAEADPGAVFRLINEG